MVYEKMENNTDMDLSSYSDTSTNQIGACAPSTTETISTSNPSPLQLSEPQSPDSGVTLSQYPYNFTKGLVYNFIEYYVDLQSVTGRMSSTRFAFFNINRLSALTTLFSGGSSVTEHRIYSSVNSVDGTPSPRCENRPSGSAFSPVTPRNEDVSVPAVLPAFTLASEYRSAIRRLCAGLQEHHSEVLGVLERFLETLNEEQAEATNEEMENGPQIQPSLRTISHGSFTLILDYMFERDISWGRIIMMLTFSSMLVLQSLKMVKQSRRPEERMSSSSTVPHLSTSLQSREACIWHYVEWTTDYIHQHLWQWILNNGGWAGLLAYEGGRSSWSSLLSSNFLLAGGVLVLGGLVAFVSYLLSRGH
jgi:hypothetical protein